MHTIHPLYRRQTKDLWHNFFGDISVCVSQAVSDLIFTFFKDYKGSDFLPTEASECRLSAAAPVPLLFWG